MGGDPTQGHAILLVHVVGTYYFCHLPEGMFHVMVYGGEDLGVLDVT
jgi:hypothetical protein